MIFQLRRWSLLVLAVMTLWLGSCTGSPTANAPQAESPVPPEEPSTPTAALPSSAANLPVLEGTATVELTVNGERIVMELDGTEAPVTAGNFVDLVNRGVYDGLVFHRVVRDPQPFVVQGGDPQSQDPNFPAQQLGTGGFVDPETQSPRNIPLEIKPQGAEQPLYNQTFESARLTTAPALQHSRGAVAMARSQLVDSASSQFYITLADLPFLDGSYAVFGYVTEGMDVVDQIEQGDVIESAQVTAGLENLKTAR
ncbi:peptidylprolyl isomerase [Pseudanabaena sp. FACHB-2040]|uniref:peptidylprolyl isomerase n=1 Tax=Pseudanabaena sp. FACHB-2040 TaxID=2692859 RepID=UPI0016835246|nr:peptidylprolyl isomerase [Pseudanabaena sp. FACHB-2040]MBD2259577.1 peptidylprolyl isomerase [Pseudanabaena sp. FACHB-2040]